MATVTELLDDLAEGRASLDETAQLFRTRKWPKPAGDPSHAQAWGEADDDSPSPDSWAAVDADSRLTADQYEVLAEAYEDALRGE